MQEKNKNSRNKNILKTEYFFGFKNSDLVVCQTEFYRQYMLLLEWDDSVTTYFQPNLNIVLSGSSKILFIDFWVVREKHETELVHFYFSEKMHAELLKAGNEHARRLNIKFSPVQAGSVLKMPFADNLERLWAHTREEFSTIHISIAQSLFKKENETTVEELENIFEANGFKKGAIYSMIFHKLINAANLENEPLSPNTKISLNPDFKFRSSPFGIRNPQYTAF